MNIDLSNVERRDSQSLDIALGARVVLQILGVGKKVATEFIGMERGKFILLRLPSQQGLRQVLTTDETVTVRCIHDQSLLYGFTTSVRGVLTAPTPLLFLDYPKTIEVLSLRRHQRANCLVPVVTYYEGQEYPGRILDVSNCGCMYLVDNAEDGSSPPYTVGNEIFCQFRMPGAENDLYAKALVKNIGELKKKQSVGVEFQDIDEEVEQILIAYVQNTQEYLMA
jgi:c-di-GMP-binding flagellar brake protein YcgR